jgi:hypothetical protein
LIGPGLRHAFSLWSLVVPHELKEKNKNQSYHNVTHDGGGAFGPDDAPEQCDNGLNKPASGSVPDNGHYLLNFVLGITLSYH